MDSQTSISHINVNTEEDVLKVQPSFVASEKKKFECTFFKYKFNALEDVYFGDIICTLEVTTSLPFNELKKAIVEGSKIKYDPTKQCMLFFKGHGSHPKIVNSLYENQRSCEVYIYTGVSEEELKNMQYCYTVNYANNRITYQGPLLASKHLNAQEILEELKKHGVEVEDKEYQIYEVLSLRKFKKVQLDYVFTDVKHEIMIKHYDK